MSAEMPAAIPAGPGSVGVSGSAGGAAGPGSAGAPRRSGRPRPRFDLADERLARAAWSRLADPGDGDASALVAHHGPSEALAQVFAGEGRPRWMSRLGSLDPAADLDLAAQDGTRMVIPGDDEWPAGLERLGETAPYCVWVRGPLDLGPAVSHSVSIVGARQATPYGLRVARELAEGCARQDISVISGAAFGIDAAAHHGALRRDGTTIAVLAGGAECVYPKAHQQLIDQIAATGCVVSEAPPGTMAARWRFLQRNRLIAALASVVVVVEAGVRSGSLSTATHAANANIPLAAVPGPVTSPYSYGTNHLLRAGGICVTSADEVAELVGPIGARFAAPATIPLAEYDGLSAPDMRVYDALPMRRGADLTSLCRVAGLEPKAVRAALGRLDLRGLVLRDATGWRKAKRAPSAQRTITPAEAT